MASVIALSLLIHADTVVSITSIWAKSKTFSHGFLIFPISLFLIWRRRKQLAVLQPQSNVWGLFAVVLASFLWVLAGAANILVAQQFAVIAMVPALVWGLLGTQVISELKFPLAYLVFAVPAGEALIPYLMDFTANFTVKAVQLSGVPVYQDGLFFSTPNGNFEVAKACSGIRYLIASIALGTLYAFLIYKSFWRRAAFVSAAILVPILANGIRAYGIVMIAHHSNLRFAVGVDHVIYGWLFFGLVMFLLFWLGSLFQENDHEEEKVCVTSVTKRGETRLVKTFIAAIVAITIVMAGPIAANYFSETRQLANTKFDIALPRGQDAWSGPEESRNAWRPQVIGADFKLHGRYASGGHEVDVYVFYYARQEQGLEMINSQNQFYDRKLWHLTQETRQAVALQGEGMLKVIATDIRSSQNKRLVWHWYSVSGRTTASRIGAKLYDAWAYLNGENGNSYMVAISTGYYSDREAAEQVLRNFVRDNYDAIRSCMAGRAQYSSLCFAAKSGH